MIDCRVAEYLFRRHVLRRADDNAHLGQRLGIFGDA